ncbi:transmembrane protein, putative [Medicago truncatula]|uniref:Transmembrane protein, putative n=1 Tax=Medicago truncatula TaxID=3880 RepID=A0A072U7K2_MEDTR|nr:transmembrane protein, putative [Medicago truncatula]
MITHAGVLWKARNERIFSNGMGSVDDLVEEVKVWAVGIGDPAHLFLAVLVVFQLFGGVVVLAEFDLLRGFGKIVNLTVVDAAVVGFPFWSGGELLLLQFCSGRFLFLFWPISVLGCDAGGRCNEGSHIVESVNVGGNKSHSEVESIVESLINVAITAPIQSHLDKGSHTKAKTSTKVARKCPRNMSV